MIETILAIATGIAFLFAYRKGLSDGLNIQNRQRVEPVLQMKPKIFSHKTKEEKDKEKRARIIASNIENYKGDAKGQVKVK